jgi:isopenicillin N synthase-like dioxygenase
VVTAVPLIDLAPEGAVVARAWDAAMRQFGFALVDGHGIDEALQQRLYDYAQDFFARPLDEKLKLDFSERGRGQGYLPLESERDGTGRDGARR